MSKEIVPPRIKMPLLVLHLRRYCEDNPMKLKGYLRKYYLGLSPRTRLRIISKIRAEKRQEALVHYLYKDLLLEVAKEPKPTRGWRKNLAKYL